MGSGLMTFLVHCVQNRRTESLGGLKPVSRQQFISEHHPGQKQFTSIIIRLKDLCAENLKTEIER